VKEKDVMHCEFKCQLCGTDIALPVCCDPEEMHVKDGVLMCNLCGSNKKVPLCCGKDMKISSNLK